MLNPKTPSPTTHISQEVGKADGAARLLKSIFSDESAKISALHEEYLFKLISESN